MDQQKTNDGKPFAPIRYKQIIKDCYLISKYLHTAYTDVLKISPTERELLLTFLLEDEKRNQKAREEAKEKAKAERKANKHRY